MYNYMIKINKIIKIIIILSIIFYLMSLFDKCNKPSKKNKKEWLFLINGNNVNIKKNIITFELTHPIIGFTDRPYHETKNVSKTEMKLLFKKISDTKNKANTTVIAINGDYSDSFLIEIDKINKINDKIEISFSLLDGEFIKNNYNNISMTIDDFFGWFRRAAEATKEAAERAAEATKEAAERAIEATKEEAENISKGIKKKFNKICKKIAYPIFEHVTTDAGIEMGCSTFCPETATTIDAAGGGPEDPVADAIATSELTGCEATCISSLKKADKAFLITTKLDKSLTRSEYLRDKLCNELFKP